MWKRENWLFVFAAIGATAALIKILEYFGITPTHERPLVTPTSPSLAPLIWGLALFAFSIGLSFYGLYIANRRIKASVLDVLKVGADDPEPPKTPTEWSLFQRAQGDFQNLSWAQKTCLLVIYQQGYVHWGELGKQLEDNLGFAEASQRIVEPIRKTTLVHVDLPNIRVGPSVDPFVRGHVEHWLGKLRRL